MCNQRISDVVQELISTVWLEMVFKSIRINVFKTQTIIINFVIAAKSWSDDRLSWAPEHFGGIKEITLPVEKIWVYRICGLHNSIYNINIID